MESTPSPYFPRDDPNTSILPSLETRHVGLLSSESSYADFNGLSYSNLFGIGTTLFVVVSIVNTETTDKRLEMRFYSQKTLNPVSSKALVLPSDTLNPIHAGTGSEGIAFDEKNQRLYVFQVRFSRLWCIKDCLTAPSIAYATGFSRPPGYYIGDVRLDTEAGAIVALWWRGSRRDPQLVVYSTSSGVEVERFEINPYFLETADQYLNYHYHTHYPPQYVFVNNPDTGRVHIVFIAHPHFHYLRSIEIPFLQDGTRIDHDRLAREADQSLQIDYPDLFKDRLRYPSSFELVMLHNNEYLIQYRQQSVVHQNSLDFCYLTPPDRHGKRRAYLTTLDFDGHEVYNRYFRTMYWLPMGRRLLITGITEKILVVPLQLLYSRPWDPSNHHESSAQTRRAVEALTFVNDLGPEARRLPPEMLFEIFSWL